MNILFMKHFFVGFMVFRYREFPYSVTFLYSAQYSVYHILNNIYIYIYIKYHK